MTDERQDLSGRLALRRGERDQHADRPEGGRRSSASTSTRTGGRSGRATKLAAKRIALWDTQTGSMPSGWTRFLLERFEFPFTIVCGAGLRRLGAALEVRRHHHAVGRGAPARWRRRSRRWRWRWRRGARAGRHAAARQAVADPDLRSLCEVTTGTGTARRPKPTSGSSSRPAAS